MSYEIGDSIKFSKKSIEKRFLKGFILAKGHTSGYVTISESGKVSTLKNSGIFLFSKQLFERSKVLLCEKNILNTNSSKKFKKKFLSSNIISSTINGIKNNNV